jgi:hypothetical protein
VIAYATSSNAQGPYTWGGIVMCGSTTEWTNQATLKTVVAGGMGKKMIVYHDSPAGKTRKLHAECLYYGSGHIAGVYRQAPNAAYGFDDCMASTSSGTWLYKGLWARDPQYPTKAPIMSTESGNSDIISKRYAVGPWERYKFELVSGNTYVIRALANGKLLCTPNSSTPIRPNCTSSSDTTAQFIRETPNPQVYSHFRLKAVSNSLYVNITSNGRLTPSGSSAADAALFAPLSPTGG